MGSPGGVTEFCYTWRCSPSHPTAPRKSPEPRVRDRICGPRAWGSGLGFLLHQSKPGFSQHQSHLHSALACLESQPPIICSMGSLCQTFVSHGPQWGPLMLQGTLSFPSDFLSSFFNLLSVLELPLMNLKCTMGLIKIQNALTSHVSSCHVLQVFKVCTARDVS